MENRHLTLSQRLSESLTQAFVIDLGNLFPPMNVLTQRLYLGSSI